MIGETKPGDAVADRWRETFEKNRRETDLSLTRLEVRAEMRSAPDLEEDTGVIHKEALERHAKRAPHSDPPKIAKGIVHILDAIKTPAQVLALAILVSALVGLILHGWKP